MMDLDINPDNEKKGVIETRWMFTVTQYPNGKIFVNKPFQVGVVKRDFAKKKGRKKIAEKIMVEGVESY